MLSTSQFNVFMGDFNINWFDEASRRPLYNFFVNDNNYRQLVCSTITNNKTLIDHIYTNLPESQARSHILEIYFSDHKAICALINSSIQSAGSGAGGAGGASRSTHDVIIF